MDGQRRCSGSEFQTTAAVIEKLRRPSLVVLIHGTNLEQIASHSFKETGTAKGISHCTTSLLLSNGGSI